MLYPSPAQDRQPSGPTPLLRELQQYCPGYFSGSEFGMFGHRRAPLEGSIGVRVTHGIAGYAGDGTTNCAVVPWQGINLNTRPELTWVLVYKKNATGILNGVIAGFGATGGSSGNTLFRISGEATANSVRFQIRDSSGTTYSNTVSSDFGADDQRYHCVVVSGVACSLDDGGGVQYYADGKKLNFVPSEVQSVNPASTLFNIATLLCARRGGAISGADGNYDVALFVPLFGIRQPDWWCEEISRNPWQLFESERRIWMPEFVAGGGDTSLRASAAASGTATARLSTQITLKASAQASGTASARLSTQIRLQASAAASGKASARLSTAISLKASATASGVASARLTTGSSTLRASATASGVASARLTTAIRLRASATASGTASARLTAGQATLRASASASGVASARLTTAIRLRASATATGTARAVLSAGDIVVEVPPQRRLIAIPGGSTAFYVPSASTDFSALDF